MQFNLGSRSPIRLREPKYSSVTLTLVIKYSIVLSWERSSFINFFQGVFGDDLQD